MTRTDEDIEKALANCWNEHAAICDSCYASDRDCHHTLHKDALDYINRLKSEKQLAETQLKELLSALYQRTNSEKGFTFYRKDVVELAKDYGIKEEELK